MKRLSGLLILIFFLSTNVSAQSSKWQSAFNTAKAEAQAQNKMILVYFTDNDSKSDEKVLYRQFWSSSTFKSMASNYVILNLKVSKERKNKANEDIYEARLKKNFNNQDKYPMVVLADALGNRTGISLSEISEVAINEFLTKLQSH
ncbi:thioredoxin family protein [Winogradskyella maritima]|uniref:Thioredoxin family protein n=1 Tax=Winogradskyella maritima TaxID=1517766 RepID=A0ABV8AFL6_9FLAO|nr:thioredoxin family protein [Winogradskyella maritima]